MKILTGYKTISGSLGLLVLLSTTTQDLSLQAKHGKPISSEEQQFKLKKLTSENAIIKDASEKIKASLQKSGHPSSVRCTYELSGSNIISTTTKIYYDEYHKRPDYIRESYLHNAIAKDKVYEIEYKKHDSLMSISIKNPKDKHASHKEVKAPKSLLA
jgi:hypothetical protein